MNINDKEEKKAFKLEFANRVIEHLGIKLYQNKPTNVIAEFVSNAWDADATRVSVDLISQQGQAPSIVITDNGRGMTRDELTDHFLIIGRNRRSAPTEKTPKGRLPMGRKGIGKLAGFGVAKTVDILSIPNPDLREDNVNHKLYWLRFQLDDIIEKSSAENVIYEPAVLADGVNLDDLTIDSLFEKHSSTTIYKEFRENIRNNQGGVCVYLHNTTLKKAINPDDLLASLGNRLSVAVLRKDFAVQVNNRPVSPTLAYPPFQDFKVGSYSEMKKETIEINNQERTISYWVAFVSLSGSNWPIEKSGAAVYAHGKIAQDRPFFFGSKGTEIYSRYLFASIHADWLDELPEDIVSTDRCSVNWDSDETELFYQWGEKKVKEWIHEYKKWKGEQSMQEIKERIRQLPYAHSFKPIEEESLVGLLQDIFPKLGNDDEAKEQAINSMAAAWIHAPTRKQTQQLWIRLVQEHGMQPEEFLKVVECLKETMVPEAMSLAVTVAQRIGAISALKKIIDSGKNETTLQKLIERFPWLLGPEWEKLTANQQIKTLIKEYAKDFYEVDETDKDKLLTRKPDFVFLSDVSKDTDIIVVEIKGPEHEKTLQPNEFFQLREYLDVIQVREKPGRPDLNLQGILIGHESGGFENPDGRIKIKTWNEVFLSARKLHISYLASLLKASNPAANDKRIKMIADFAGKEAMELLKSMNVIVDYDEEIITHLPVLGKS